MTKLKQCVKKEYISKMEKGVFKFLKDNPKFKSMTKQEFNGVFKSKSLFFVKTIFFKNKFIL